LRTDDDVAVTLAASALLFDMDGTLVDSTAAVERAWAIWARRHKLDLAEVLYYSHGRPTRATMNFFGERILPGNNWTGEADEMQRMERTEISGTKAIGGARELLGQLNDGQWAVVTSAPRELAEARIKAAGLPLPRVLVPADEIADGKPHPEGYLKAARELGVAASDCLVFEDTPPGVDAGINAGMQVVGLLTTVEGERLGTPNLIRDYFDLRVRRSGGRFEIEIGR
jgi:sugar-phosphatase